MAFAKRHYVRVAEYLKTRKPAFDPGQKDEDRYFSQLQRREQWELDVKAVADAFQEFEPLRFQRHAFLTAAGWKEENK